MGKKKEDPPPPGAPAWMATFSDLMNLLLCFFALLFSMSSVDAKKYDEVAKSFAETFSIFQAGGSAIGDGTMVNNGVSQLNELSVYFSSMGLTEQGSTNNEIQQASDEESDQNASGGMEGEDEKLAEAKEELTEAQLEASEQLAEQIEEMLSETTLGQEIDVDYTSQYVLLTVNGALLFDSGSDTIKEDALPYVDKIGELLVRYADGTIEIEGHTDNVPVGRGGRYSSNDELSGARALSVFDYLISHTSLDPAKIKHSGRGEYVPVADNSTPEGRAKNRRVEVKIYNGLSDSL
ncbi:MAG: flagellar motor protein MotB [Lachnospiraceae bacterium]|nr:flagellar motor protein MotB [Lachnospiraceae bacterium]